MLKIRFSKIGRKHEPVYRLVLTDHKNAAKSGKFHEILGSYDSRRGEKAEFKAERITYWISKGAQLSDTAHNLLLKLGIITGTKRNILPAKVIQAAKDKKLEKDKPAPESVVEAAPEPVVEEKVESDTVEVL